MLQPWEADSGGCPPPTVDTAYGLHGGVDAIEHIVGAMWRAKGDEQLTSIVTEGKKALAAIIGKDTELKTIAVNAGAEDGWLPDGA